MNALWVLGGVSMVQLPLRCLETHCELGHTPGSCITLQLASSCAMLMSRCAALMPSCAVLTPSCAAAALPALAVLR